MNSIKNTVKIIVSLISFMVLAGPGYAGDAEKKVVMVLTGYGQNQGDEKPGYEFDEFAKAYLVFKQNNINVDIASPKGGQVEASQFDKNKPFNITVLADEQIMAKLANTLSISTLNAKAYDGVFIVGGKGAMFDLPKDKALQTLIADIYQQQGSIAAVCHGPAALIDVKLNNGQYLVSNKTVNGFTNKEEQLFGQKWLKEFDFLLEDKLIERGAKFQSSDILLSHVAVDERLITGQNPTSTVGVAVALVKSMGLTPVEVSPDLDDKTLAVVAQYLSGDKTIIEELTQHKQQYHIPLVGMYGFYYLKSAQTNLQFEHALNLMLVAQDDIKNTTLDMSIAKTQYKLGMKTDAKHTLNHVLKAKPDYQPALDMLKELSE